jgi:hypothetical protein
MARRLIPFCLFYEWCCEPGICLRWLGVLFFCSVSVFSWRGLVVFLACCCLGFVGSCFVFRFLVCWLFVLPCVLVVCIASCTYDGTTCTRFYIYIYIFASFKKKKGMHSCAW